MSKRILLSLALTLIVLSVLSAIVEFAEGDPVAAAGVMLCGLSLGWLLFGRGSRYPPFRLEVSKEERRQRRRLQASRQEEAGEG